jgi:hypothetical protein
LAESWASPWGNMGEGFGWDIGKGMWVKALKMREKHRRKGEGKPFNGKKRGKNKNFGPSKKEFFLLTFSSLIRWKEFPEGILCAFFAKF